MSTYSSGARVDNGALQCVSSLFIDVAIYLIFGSAPDLFGWNLCCTSTQEEIVPIISRVKRLPISSPSN